jgi:serine/threonine protein phosphatase 1
MNAPTLLSTDTATRLPGHGTDGRLVYAIGDIHGRADLFDPLLDKIGADAEERCSDFADRPLLVLLGDYVDRGHRSREVLDRIVRLCGDPRFEVRCLLGNHEEAMLNFIDHRTSGGGWSGRGGRETMESYGVSVPSNREDRHGWSCAREQLSAALPAAHEKLLRELILTTGCGDLLFVHAGLRPNIALEAQEKRDLLWIRRDFLESDHVFEKLIVHGHTPIESAFIGGTRINLDTGAYASGILSAARFDGSAPVLIEVGRRPE